ncbi:reverse transcriptase domain, reverse transcriptase zinc-binding domain protein [Tanacetum coccineum]
MNSDNIEVTGSNVADVFVSHYKMFLGSDMVCDNLNMDGLFLKKVSADSFSSMVRPVTDEEIKAAMFSIGDERAPGPDGFSSAFFKKGWDIVGWTFVPVLVIFFVNGKRGLRQGDPLSPYLFTLIMEVLTLMIKRRVNLSGVFRYNKHCEELQLVNVCFADDLFIFARGDLDSARVIMESLDDVQCILRGGNLPVKYLGVPLISSRLLNKDSKVLVEKAKNRIEDWKNKSLSFAGRQDAWDDICLPKCEGGLGLRSLDLRAWEAFRPRGNEVNWFRIVWFPHSIPRHSFHLWLVMRNSLKTQDKLRQWDVGINTDLNLLRCSLCNTQSDSHAHLFFECPYSSKVWKLVRHLADMELVPPILYDIVAHLLSMANKRTARSIFGKLILAASSYFVWLERNNRLFKNVKRTPEELRDVIMVTVRLKLLSFKFKNSANVISLLDRWKMPRSFRLYVC